MTAGGWFGHNPGSSYSYWLTKDSIENVAVNETTHTSYSKPTRTARS